jgi:adenylate cyclase
MLLHPLFELRGATWIRGEVGATVRTMPHGFMESRIPFGGPPRILVEGAEAFVARTLQGPFDHTILEDVHKLGSTDYALWPFKREGEIVSMTAWCLAMEDLEQTPPIDLLREVHQAFSLVADHLEQPRQTRALLHTYLGEDAGDQVFDGNIRRGDGSTTRAAIFFLDLRGFTTLSEEKPRDVVLGLLNETFELAVKAIESQGGHVLKFIGDALLAIRPVGLPDDGAEECAALLRAAGNLEKDLAVVNERRRPHRLDYTVIGPAVNQAARLEKVGASLGVRPALSDTFAQRCGRPVQLVEKVDVKGVSGLEVWTPDS